MSRNHCSSLCSKIHPIPSTVHLQMFIQMHIVHMLLESPSWFIMEIVLQVTQLMLAGYHFDL
jgi:hypothetical protein